MEHEPFAWIIIEIECLFSWTATISGFEFHVMFSHLFAKLFTTHNEIALLSPMHLFHAICGFALLTDSHFSPDVLRGRSLYQNLLHVSGCVQVSWLKTDFDR